MFYILRILIFLLILNVTGCKYFAQRIKSNMSSAKKNINCFVDVEKKKNVLRVLVMPVANSSNEKSIENTVYDSMILSFSKFNYFEVSKYSDFPEETIKALEDSFKYKSRGVINKEPVKQFGQDFKIDAIIFPEVFIYRAYNPLLLGYKHFMFNTIETDVVWSVDDTMDMGNSAVNTLARNWYYKNYRDNYNPSLKSDIMEFSMSYFVNFSMDAFFETWKKTA
ncbi:MAG: hypothetical protein ACD_79C00644G0005 [uncultured bacterium]|nr:MAG: hypothetical protein ACD_79C00644G0005 [uncultured bacterium]